MRTRRLLLPIAASLLLLVLSSCLEMVSPLAGALVFSLIAAAVAYLVGYFLARKAREGRERQRRNVALAAFPALALLLLMACLGARAGRQPALPLMAIGCAVIAGLVAIGWGLGRKDQMRKKDPARESALAHRYLDGLKGLEIGGALHNPFGLDTWNVDYTASLDTVYKRAEIEFLGAALPVDIVASGDELPIRDESVDFVLASHALEHFRDPIKALKEWYRVVRPAGYIFLIVPHRERTFDRDRPRTTLSELIRRHETGESPGGTDMHQSVWVTEDVVELVQYLGWRTVEVHDVDDKFGNGFTIVVQKA